MNGSLYPKTNMDSKMQIKYFLTNNKFKTLQGYCIPCVNRWTSTSILRKTVDVNIDTVKQRCRVSFRLQSELVHDPLDLNYFAERDTTDFTLCLHMHMQRESERSQAGMAPVAHIAMSVD